MSLWLYPSLNNSLPVQSYIIISNNEGYLDLQSFISLIYFRWLTPLNYDDDDDDLCFTATFVHMVGYMGRVTSECNENLFLDIAYNSTGENEKSRTDERSLWLTKATAMIVNYEVSTCTWAVRLDS